MHLLEVGRLDRGVCGIAWSLEEILITFASFEGMN